jgi:hypothetical protein
MVKINSSTIFFIHGEERNYFYNHHMDKGASMPDLEYSGIISVGAFFLEE